MRSILALLVLISTQAMGAALTDPAPLFPILVNSDFTSTSPNACSIGTAASGKTGMVVFDHKDSSGNLILPTTQGSGSQIAQDVGVDVAGVQVDPRINPFGTVAITHPSTIANTAVLVLALNTSRRYAMISTPQTPLTCQLGSSTGLTTNQGFQIAQGGFYEFNANNLYTGAIYCISAMGGKAVTVTEGTQ